ncbi:MAG: protease complex subunit PrcB family protein [Rubrobacter sp.]|nr:protease complex subunit PrcB family protein [Rubrobacter sp.]
MARSAVSCAGLILLYMMLAACAAGGSGSPGDESGTTHSSENTRAPSETTGRQEETHLEKSRPEKPGKAGSLNVEQLTSEAPGQGPKRPRILLASSASGLSRSAGTTVPDAGEGTYLAVFRGEKPTGGYSVEITSARVEGDRVTIRISLKDPPSDAMVTQALTYPYATAVIRNESLASKELLLEDQDGRKLDWKV